ncbi:hypothetical protein BDY19DRAFT_969281 [Irpex rosettiformis]|uniref:Uncharacterized protein n=1 Tax=Irpex rosettiformis TaxID=378272 RepID=A0ACB8TS46_9APHY|nr:hypothetical protein BDY19DRAFT_969281 [Irpex rosettiformis]
MQAREAQFELKNGKRHHPYSAKEVPYPLYYEQSVIDYGIWEVMWMKSVTKDMTWHPLEAVPQKVLDLGCGSGNWILECARQWKDTHFVGLDIVPIQPDLYQLGTSQMASRITWVQANFLERLPFQDEEFDYICARRIARGVPEDKWDGLLEEITRLLRPGGSFELIEEELCFPGKLVYPQPEALVDLDVAISPLPSSDHWMSDPFSSSDSLSPPTSSSSSSHYPPVAYPQAQWPLTRTSSGTSLSPGTSNSPPLTQIVTSHLSLSSRTLSKSPLHRMTLPPTMEEDEHSLHPGSDCAPELREPIDPRDHSLLEFIYNEVHTSRFINLEPLALLQNTFSLYFEDSCIHPPIILTFPPRLNSTSTSLPNTTSEKLDKGTHLDEETNVVSLLASSNPYVLIDDDRFNPFFGKPRSLAPEDSITSIYERFWNGDNDPSRTGSDDDNILGRRRRVLREGHTSRCRKPLEGIDFRLESLNMLLALRVQEVVGCAEEMWSWVAHYQNTQYNSPAVGAGSLWAKEKPYHQTLVQMNRLDFDEIVMRFQLDMQEQIGMGKVVQDRLGWKEVSTARTQAQKEFDMLSAEWIIHKKSLKQKPTSTVTSTMSTPRLDSLSLTDESEGHERLNNVAAPFLSANGKMHPSTDGHGADRSAVPLSSLEPWQRISRKMIVAVGWKAGGKNGP